MWDPRAQIVKRRSPAERKGGRWKIVPPMQKAKLNLCQTRLKDLGIGAISARLSGRRSANNSAANACCSISFHIILCQAQVTDAHQADKTHLPYRAPG